MKLTSKPEQPEQEPIIDDGEDVTLARFLASLEEAFDGKEIEDDGTGYSKAVKSLKKPSDNEKAD